MGANLDDRLWGCSAFDDLQALLEKIDIKLAEDDDEALNFTTAGRKIAESSHIYSKRVDNLHSLACNCQDLLVKKNQKKNTNLVTIDDWLSTPWIETIAHKITTGKHLNMTKKNETVAPLRRVPLLLLPRGGKEGASARDQFSTCNSTIHCSGALLLEEGDAFQIDQLLQPGGGGSLKKPMTGRRRASLTTAPIPQEEAPLPETSETYDHSFAPDNENYAENDDNQMAVAFSPDESMIDTGGGINEQKGEEGVGKFSEASRREGRLTERALDPWNPLDPFEPIGKPRPLKATKIIRAPCRALMTQKSDLSDSNFENFMEVLHPVIRSISNETSHIRRCNMDLLSWAEAVEMSVKTVLKRKKFIFEKVNLPNYSYFENLMIKEQEKIRARMRPAKKIGLTGLTDGGGIEDGAWMESGGVDGEGMGGMDGGGGG
eukprot:GHVL01021393.1.p1 GENE.GHVL01021393.1~~GHVL01021393.1.p1  ORF type:complete len:432 (+),score=118.21 GHVL01021393.1:31-1326(+)